MSMTVIVSTEDKMTTALIVVGVLGLGVGVIVGLNKWFKGVMERDVFKGDKK